jgi:hypothetical protein
MSKWPTELLRKKAHTRDFGETDFMPCCRVNALLLSDHAHVGRSTSEEPLQHSLPPLAILWCSGCLSNHWTG